MSKILVVEDEAELRALICEYLEGEGYTTVSAADGLEALTLFQADPCDMIVTDVMMPKMDGFTLAERIRKTDSTTPILFLTALGDKRSKQLGFTLGIDDYMTKPFDLDELVFRVRAILRRASTKEDHTLTVGNLVMDSEEHTAYVDGVELPLTVREFDLLFKLLSYPKKTFTRSALMDEFWDYDSSATSRSVDVYMAKIREKTADCNGFELVTVHGLGYKAVLK
ncbi:MAG: response regulator transcription factor [Clostridia bacterium]|nr:response regulator transcription factor [Clostridia bacterium]